MCRIAAALVLALLPAFAVAQPYGPGPVPINGADISSATVLATSALNARTTAAMAADRINVLNQSVVANGSDTTSAINAAITLATSLNKAAYFPCGVYTVDGVNVTSTGAVLVMDSCASFRRKNSASRGYVFQITAANVFINSLTLDGNKSNNSVLANNLNLNGSSQVTIGYLNSQNANDAGFNIQSTADAANNTASVYGQLILNNNTFAGFLLSGAASNMAFLDVTTNSNGGAGGTFSNIVFPVTSATTHTISNITIGTWRTSNNGTTGLGFSGFLCAGSTGFTAQINCPGYDPVYNLIVDGIISTNNGGYGAVTQVDGSYFGRILTIGNGSNSPTTQAGLLAGAENTTFGSVTNYEPSAFYGTDAGGCFHCHFVSMQGYGATGMMLDLEANQWTEVDWFDYWSFGTGSSGHGVKLDRVGSSGAVLSTGGATAFAWDANHVKINGGFCQLANAFQSCVTIIEDPQFISVHNVHSTGSENSANVFLFQAQTVPVEFDNVKTDGSDPYLYTASLLGPGNGIFLPDWVTDAETIFAPNAGPVINIYTTSVLQCLQSVCNAPVTAPGSGYGHAIATATGGGCSPEPTFTVGETPVTGAVANIRVATIGVGCTSAPTITITDSNGSGSGATATAVVGLWNMIQGRKLTLRSLASQTFSIVEGGHIFTPLGNPIYMTRQSIAEFTGDFNGSFGSAAWYTKSMTYQTANVWLASGCSNSAVAGVTKPDGSMTGQFISGTSGTCGVTLTAGSSITAPHGYQCAVRDVTTGAAFTLSSSSTSTAAITGTTTSGDTVAVNCSPY